MLHSMFPVIGYPNNKNNLLLVSETSFQMSVLPGLKEEKVINDLFFHDSFLLSFLLMAC